MSENSKTLPHITCPHLGLIHDPQTVAAYPTTTNICQRDPSRNSPALAHQQQFCLTDQYIQCPIYKAAPAQPDISALRNQANIPARQFTLPPVWIIVGILLVLGTLLIVAVVSLSGQQAVSTQPTLRVETDTALPAPSPTIGLTWSPIHRLDTKIGLQAQYLMYTVKSTDSMEELSFRYKVTQSAIRAVNYREIPPLTPNDVIVIPLNASGIKNIPWLEAYQVRITEISLEDLAIKLKTDVELMKEINECPENCLLRSGDWVLLPHPRP